jgi:hypothetical protein
MMPRLISIVLLVAGLPLAVAGVEVARTAGVDMLGSLAWAHAVVAAMIAGWSGMAATLGRYMTARRAGTAWDWSGEIGRDLFVSATVGAGGYWMGSTQGLTSMELGAGLLVAGYAGVRALDWAADRMFGVKRESDRNG